jgi:hypothetical protein
LSVNTKDLINKAVFAGLKVDLNAVKTVGKTADQKAIGYLIKARDDYSKGTQAYNDLIAKGIPKFLRDKPINEIEFPDLVNAYEGLTGSQRKLFRTWVGENRAESLQAIDKAVFDNFKNKAFKEVRGGKQSYDLGVMAREWERLRKTDPEKAAMLTDALGTNASEFSKRMKDALVFTRKMEVGAQKAGTAFVPGQQQAAALAGAVGGYPAAKVTDLTIEAINASMKKNGISDETLMKLLLTDEGASFLKTASLSPQGRETLEKLTSLNRATIPETVSWLAAGQPAVNGMRGVEPTQETAVAEEEIIIPDELPAEFMQSAPAEEEIIIPDELPAEFSDQPTSDPLGQFIQNLPQQAQASPAMDEIDASVMQRLQQLKKQKDPDLNIDFVFNAFKTAPSDKKQNMIRMMGL